MEQISDAKIYERLTSPRTDISELKKEQEELGQEIHRLLTNYVETCKAEGKVDKNGKVRLFPEICDTPDLILEQYPMTEEQILSVKDYDKDLLYDAVDFLHGDNKGKIASTMYLCAYAKYHGLEEL
jgi:hypothetical protein